MFSRPLKKPRTRGDMKGVSTYRRYVGHSKGKHTVAVGVGSTNRLAPTLGIDSPWYLVGLSLVKYILKREFDVDLVTPGSTIYSLVPPVYHTQSNVVKNVPRWFNLSLYWRKTNDFNSTVVQAEMSSFTNTTTVSDLAKDLGKHFRDYVSGRGENTSGSVDNSTWRQGYRFYGYACGIMEAMGGTQTDPTSRSITGVRRCEDMIMSMKIRTVVKIQNTTPSINMNSTGDQVHNSSGSEGLITEPLKGKMFHFSDPVAMVRHAIDTQGVVPDYNVLNYPLGGVMDSLGSSHHWLGHDNNDDGIITLGQASDDALVLRHIPMPDIWQNCKGYTNVYLNPGEAKTHVMTFKFDGYINKLLEGFAIDQYDYATQIRQQDNLGFGTLDLFFFEEANKSDITDTGQSLTTVNIGYSVERWCRCKVKKNITRGTHIVRDYIVPNTLLGVDTTLATG